MELSVIAVGSYMTNCWLLKDEKTGRAVVVDPGFYSSGIENFLKRNGVEELEYILITHGHLDHICGVSYLKEKFGGKIVIGEKEADELEKFSYSISDKAYEESFKPCKADIVVTDGDELDFCGEKIEIIFTPGHTKGEVCYIINNMMFSGDVLFRGSMGRTDLPGGDIFKMMFSLKKIASFEENFMILPGHGEKTTLEFEKMTNMYLKAACRKNDT